MNIIHKFFLTANKTWNIIPKEFSRIYSNVRIFATLSISPFYLLLLSYSICQAKKVPKSMHRKINSPNKSTNILKVWVFNRTNFQPLLR